MDERGRTHAVEGDPMADVLYGPLISPQYLANHEHNLGLAAAHHSVHGSTGSGRTMTT